jgi:hypothetical protein
MTMSFILGILLAVLLLIPSFLSALQLGVNFALLNNLPQFFSPWFFNNLVFTV